MKTLYIDVYFLINFTVDLLALYLSARMEHIKTTISRLMLCSLVGAACAVADVFVEFMLFKLVIYILSLIAICIIISSRVTVIRRVRFMFFFTLCEFIIGGVVSFGYSALDRLSGDFWKDAGGSENRGALVLSAMILFSIGVIKLLIMLFTNKGSRENIKLKIVIEDKSIVCDAFLDNGNLVIDPMNMSPVIFIKKRLARQIIPESVIELEGLDDLSEGFKKRIRLIPVTRVGQTHIVTGVRADAVFVLIDGREEEVDFTIAIDKEGGTFAGYEAIAPQGALNNVI